MKKALFFQLAVLLCLMVGCAEFLNKDPQDEISKEEALNDIFSIRLALNGAYNALGVGNYYGMHFLVYPELTGGNVRLKDGPDIGDINNYEPIYDFNLEANNEDVNLRFAYAELYEALNAVNNIIEAIPSITDGSEAESDQVLGEALALRALIHHDLLRLYAQPFNFTADAAHIGVVTLETSPLVSEELSRSSVSAGYDLIVRDLEAAILLLDDFQGPFFISAEGAKALLARVMLYMENWSRAASLANEVISSGRIDLATHDQLDEIWANSFNRDEYVFRLDLSATQSDLVARTWGRNTIDPSFEVTTDLLKLYSEGDVRGPGSMLLQGGEGTWETLKFPYNGNTPANVPIIRISEVYLTRAEAYAELQRPELALEDLNTIRLRANPETDELENLNGEALIDSILVERRRELAFEGHLFFDLTRKQRGVQRSDCQPRYNCNVAYPNDKFILPIPQAAIFANRNLEQNEGY